MDLTISGEGFVLVADRDEGLVILQGQNEFEDLTPPAPVLSLDAETFSAGAVRLSWYATGDDGMMGSASDMEVRFADTPIVDEAAWDAATVLEDTPAPELPGTEMSFVVTDMSPEEKHFAVRFTDHAGLTSKLSNPASAAPGDRIVLFDPTLNFQQGNNQTSFVYELTYYFPTLPSVHQVIIDGTPYDMTPVEDKGDDTTFRYETQLGLGFHTYSFLFESDDPDIPVATTEEVDGPVVGAIMFSMGSSNTTDEFSPEFEPGRDPDEWQHMVVFNDSLMAAPTEVTQAQWIAMGMSNPSHFVGDNLPVESISWLQAIEYCNALSSDDGLTPAYEIDGAAVTWDRANGGWRLPTEAEWEWLCRSGSTTTFAGGALEGLVCQHDQVLDSMGWYCGSSFPDFPSTNEIQQKQANDLDLYDMHGNVWEWCWDWYGDYRLGDVDGNGVVSDPLGASTGTQRVVRGGSWYGGSEDCRSANRGARYPDSADDVVGMRVVRTIFSTK